MQELQRERDALALGQQRCSVDDLELYSWLHSAKSDCYYFDEHPSIWEKQGQPCSDHLNTGTAISGHFWHAYDTVGSCCTLFTGVQVVCDQYCTIW